MMYALFIDDENHVSFHNSIFSSVIKIKGSPMLLEVKSCLF